MAQIRAPAIGFDAAMIYKSKFKDYDQVLPPMITKRSIDTLNREDINEIRTEFTISDELKFYSFDEAFQIMCREMSDGSCTTSTIKNCLLNNWTKEIKAMNSNHFILPHGIIGQSSNTPTNARCNTLRYYSNNNRSEETRRQNLDFRNQAFDRSSLPNEIPQDQRDMKKEINRLKSFDYGERFQIARSHVSVEQLAADGFYYLLVSDHVKCAFCKGVLRDWKPGEIPFEEHRRHFSTCPFVLYVDVNNVPISDKYNDCRVSEACTGTNDPAQHNGDSSPSIASCLQRMLRLFESTAGVEQLALGQYNSTCRSDITVHDDHGNQINDHGKSDYGLLTDIWQQQIHHSRDPVPETAATAATADNAIVNLDALFVRLKNQQSHGQLQYKHPSMSRFLARKLSLSNASSVGLKSPQQSLYIMAKAGFCIINDCICCYCCGLVCNSWPTRDDAWVLHARYSPRCAHLLLNRGVPFVLGVRRLLPPVPPRMQQHQQQQQQSINSEQQQQQQQQQEERRYATGEIEVASPFLEYRIEPRDIKARIDLPANRLMSVIGFSTTEVKIAVELRLRSFGDDFASIELLLQALLKQRKIIRSRNQNPEEYFEEIIRAHQRIQSQPPRSRDTQDWKTCKVCMDKEVNIVLMECGHLCCCSDCVKNLKTCPMCRAPIRATLVLKED